MTLRSGGLSHEKLEVLGTMDGTGLSGRQWVSWYATFGLVCPGTGSDVVGCRHIRLFGKTRAKLRDKASLRGG